MEILPADLRIGNYYNSTKFGTPVKCEMADFWEIYQRAEGATPDESDIAEIFEPIPLTEDWLIKFGFASQQESKEFYFYKDNVTVLNGLIKYQDYVTYFDGDLDVKLRYVHQLQNLYFVLTENELKHGKKQN